MYVADGFFTEKKTWVEFNTCFSYGCKDCYPDQTQICPLTFKPYGEIFAASKHRTDLIAKCFKVEIYWECKLKKCIKENNEFRCFFKNTCLIPGRRISRKSYMDRELLQNVENGSFLLVILCSANVAYRQARDF